MLRIQSLGLRIWGCGWEYWAPSADPCRLFGTSPYASTLGSLIAAATKPLGNIPTSGLRRHSSDAIIGHFAATVRVYSPPYLDRIWGIWGSYYNIPKAVSFLLQGDYIVERIYTMHLPRLRVLRASSMCYPKGPSTP